MSMGKRDDEFGPPPGQTAAQKMLQAKIREAGQRSKYNNVRVRWNDRWFDSKYELDAAKKLEASRKAKVARDRVVKLEYQVRFAIIMRKTKICDYVADFVVEYADGRVDVIDAKGVKTAVYNLKKKMLKAVHGIDIVEM